MGSLTKIGPAMRPHGAFQWISQGMGLTFTLIVTIYLISLATKAVHQEISKPEKAH